MQKNAAELGSMCVCISKIGCQCVSLFWSCVVVWWSGGAHCPHLPRTVLSSTHSTHNYKKLPAQSVRSHVHMCTREISLCRTVSWWDRRKIIPLSPGWGYWLVFISTINIDLSQSAPLLSVCKHSLLVMMLISTSKLINQRLQDKYNSLLMIKIMFK